MRSIIFYLTFVITILNQSQVQTIEANNFEDPTIIACKFVIDRGEKTCEIDDDVINSQNFEIQQPQNSSKILKIMKHGFRDVEYIPLGIGDKFENLTALILSKNRIKVIDKAVLMNLRNLKLLFLDDNEIPEIPEDSFDDLDSVEILDLDENRISILTPRMLRNLPKLTELSIHDNFIKFLDEKIFARNLKLKTVKLNNNKLISLSPKMIDNLKVLNTLNLEGNCVNKKFKSPNIFSSYAIEVADKCSNGNCIKKILIFSSCILILLSILIFLIFTIYKKYFKTVEVKIPNAFENENYLWTRKASGVTARYRDESFHERNVRYNIRNMAGVTSDSENLYEEIDLNSPKENCLKFSYKNYRFPKNGSS